MTDFKHLENIRTYELGLITPRIPEGSTVLEVGAGSGYQAMKLAELGHRVEAIDIPGSRHEIRRIWPVLAYDGHDIPFPDNHFDIVYSSSVLEHIPHIVEFQSEIQRVLKPGGLAIHVLPATSWRFWTSLAHYFFALKAVYRSITRTGGSAEATENRVSASTPRNIAAVLFPQRHGERGNAITELVLFNRRSWQSLFQATGWEVAGCYPNRLFYTGYCVLGSNLNIQVRQRLSAFLGSSCLIYVLKASNKRS